MIVFFSGDWVGQWAVLGLGCFGLGGFMWLFEVWLSGSKKQERSVLVMQDFC